MTLVQSFAKIQNQFRSLTNQLVDRRTNNAVGNDLPRLKINEINAEVKIANESFRECSAVLDAQRDASEQAAASVKDFMQELKLLVEDVDGDNSNFMAGSGGTRKILSGPKDLKDLLELSQTLKDTMQLMETVQELLQKSVENSRQGEGLTEDVDLELDRLIISSQKLLGAREERLKREEEERLKREEEERLKREEEERLKSEEEERLKREEEERLKREEERLKREEERLKREEEERLKREEEERLKSEEKERLKREEEERLKREEEERLKREEEERLKSEEEERLKREEERLKREEERLKREEEERLKREEERLKREEERLKREEEERLKREEERLKREEEERLKREEEERKRLEIENQLKRESELRQRQAMEEARRKREAAEKIKRDLEEKRLLLDEERNWQAIELPIQDSKEAELWLNKNRSGTNSQIRPPGCAIRAPKDSFIRDEFRCHDISDELQAESFGPHDELACRPIRLEAIGRSELGGNFRGRPIEWFVALPHSAPQLPGRETVMFAYKNDRWIEQPSSEIRQDSLSSQFTWLETRFSKAPITIVLVTRWKVNRFSLTSRGAEVISPADSRIRLSIPADSFSPKDASLDQAFEARLISADLIEDLQTNLPEPFKGVLTTSAIVVHTSSESKTLRPPANYRLHVPKSSANKLELSDPFHPPGVASAGVRRLSVAPQRLKNSRRHSSSATVSNSTSEDRIILAEIDTDDDMAHWTALEIIDKEELTGKDVLTVKITNLKSRRMLALRTTKKFDIDQLDFVCKSIESEMATKTATLVVRLSADENSRKAVIALPTETARPALLELLTSHGFKQPAPGPTSLANQDWPIEIRVRERQLLQIEITGNITSVNGDQLTLKFNSQDFNWQLVTLSPKDPYLQTSLPRYRGFVQVFSELQPDQLAKQPVQLAKLKSDRSEAPIWKSPFQFKAKDAVNMDYLVELAVDIQNNWQALADQLGVSRERCSVIRNVQSSEIDQALEMLVHWFKGTTVKDSKMEILSKALKQTGYIGLAKDLQQRQRQLNAQAND